MSEKMRTNLMIYSLLFLAVAVMLVTGDRQSGKPKPEDTVVTDSGQR